MGLKAVKTSAGTSRFLWLPVWRQRLIMLDEIPLRPVVLVNQSKGTFPRPFHCKSAVKSFLRVRSASEDLMLRNKSAGPAMVLMV